MHIDRRFRELVGTELPIVLAPMAGPGTPELAIAVAEAGGLGSLPCAMLGDDQIRAGLGIIRQRTSRPINLNFFCHKPARPDATREAEWRRLLEPYYIELGLDTKAEAPSSNRKSFDSELCSLVEELRPEIVSFHFGLPEEALLGRVKAAGAKVISSATTVAEAKWLESRGCDAIIAQGAEAGGHRGMFLTSEIDTQSGTMALVPQVVDAVSVPVIAAGGIADSRGIVAALALGASAVQIGTAYLFCPEAKVPPVHQAALRNEAADNTALTNIFTGRPARGIVNRLMRELGPMSRKAPEFPLAGGPLSPLRAASEPNGSGDFMSLWSGQGAPLAVELPAGELTRKLWAEAMGQLGPE
ncbi:nitronate monooxygenase [Mesorhizobium sp. BAC0120]|uniref:NAD(P)H-dependent flavin oxidoreductase n=1 Tax=Mesorhizobium sp. BAC0120 TaxID=3090670 RepID=UPI00298C3DF5|nr:nitronate monooxygenase [Mesorhizobium sp. BAC0120]MDW6022250.1 nitronate monooxygenase [Mesorhizobium sp. BAC0120]